MLNVVSPITFSSENIDEDTIVQVANAFDQNNFIALLDFLNETYHNEEAIVSDETFDELVDLYEAKFQPYQVIGAEPTREKVTLPYFLSSLNKIKTDKEIALFSTTNPGPYIIQDKIDGITLLLLYSPNSQTKIYTRGGGLRGMDVSHLLSYIKFPRIRTSSVIAIRGELVMNKNVFNRIGAGYKNPRNMLSGKVIAKESFNPDIVRELSFYAFRIVNKVQSVLQDILELNSFGFILPYIVTSTFLSFQLLLGYFNSRKEQAPYEMDGLVIYDIACKEYPPTSNPKHIIAFKPPTERIPVIVTGVEWTASRTRRLKPVVLYETTFFSSSGADLSRATGHNARFIINNGIGHGAKVMVTRSGDAIPTVLFVITPALNGPSWPDPNIYGNYFWDTNGTELVITEDNDEVIAAKLEYFLRVLGIESIGPGRIASLVRAGVKDINRLLTINPNELILIEGIGPKLANQLYNDLHVKTKNVPLAKLMNASGIFTNIGDIRTQAIVEEYPDILQLAQQPPNIIINYISKIKGFNKLAEEVAYKLPYFLNWLREHPQITYSLQSTPQVQNGKLSGMTIVLSGTRDKDLINAITSSGGKLGSDVSKNTNILVMKDVTDLKGKGQKALKLGIPIMSAEEFSAKYL